MQPGKFGGCKTCFKATRKKSSCILYSGVFILFICGLAFGYFFIFPNILSFLINLGSDLMTISFTADKISF
ncbi:twin-arginine translocase subunit TatC [Peribacillus sp. YIM B13482]|uniref:twin-arginine translocase subunit TatC n=1 Tax=Peribacillus sp. YIM B13482 TaxID=3366298 RepID=UPI00366C20CC